MPIGTPKIGTLTREGTSSGSMTVAYPSGVASGDLLLIAIPARALNTDAAFALSGWTVIANQAGQYTRMTFLWRFATAAHTGSVTVTGPAVLRSAKMLAVSGVDQTTPFEPHTVFTGSDAETNALVSIPGQTPTRAGSLLLWGVTGFQGAGCTWQSTKNQVVNSTNVTEWLDTWEESTTSSTVGRSGAAYYEPWPDTSATGNRGGLPSVAATSSGVLLVIRPVIDRVDASGSLAATGSGALSFSDARITTARSIALAGGSALAFSNARPGVPGALTLTGSSELSWVASLTVAGALQLTGSGDLVLSDSRYGVRGPDTALSGSGSLALSDPVVSRGGSLVLSGGSSLTLTPLQVVVAGATLLLASSGALAVAPTRVVVTRESSLVLASSGALALSGSKPGMTGALSLDGSGDLDRTVTAVRFAGSLALSGGGLLRVGDPLAVPVYVWTGGTWRQAPLWVWSGRDWIPLRAADVRIY